MIPHAPAAPARRPLAQTLADVYADVAAACDGGRLLTKALAAGTANPLLARDLADVLHDGRPARVLALGKVALPMLEGLLADITVRPPRSGLVVTTAAQAARNTLALPHGFALHIGEHPLPGVGSHLAGRAVRDFVVATPENEALIVLLSGGGSALAVMPAATLSLADKVAATAALAQSGADIRELNTVRKHLSAIKGGQLAALARGRVVVIALSDVIGDDPSVIASGPFFPDPTTYQQAAEILARQAPGAPAAAHEHLRAGARGAHPETYKLPAAATSIAHHILAGPSHVRHAARAAVVARGWAPARGEEQTEVNVEALADIYTAHALAGANAAPCVLIGNGEPRIALPTHIAPGCGGRASHLALLMARTIDGLQGTAFLAAGTDDRDGNSDAAGAVVDGGTWKDAHALGLDPQIALERHDSASLLARLGALVVAPARSNLLDLHLLACGAGPLHGGTTPGARP